MWPPISTARSDAPRSVYQSFPAWSRSTSSGRSASDSASQARPLAQVSVHATRCSPFSSPVSERSSEKVGDDTGGIQRHWAELNPLALRDVW